MPHPRLSTKAEQDRIAELERQLAEAKAQIAALQWRPITPENSPKVGDEAYSCNDGDVLEVRSCDLGTYSKWTNAGWTHFRPINPPSSTRHGHCPACANGELPSETHLLGTEEHPEAAQ